MLVNRLMLYITLGFQAAISLLGNVGLHSALGCHHTHETATACAVTRTDSGHSHSRCNHTHCHRETTPAGDGHKHSPHPLTDDDCAICQFFIRPMEAAEYYQWSPLVIAFTYHFDDVAEQPGYLFELFYEVRGPPVVA